MNWYSKITKEASKPPAYIIERISDLEHAMELMGSSISEAKKLVLQVSSKLAEHNDNEFVGPLTQAAGRIIDNPNEAKEIIGNVIGMMIIAKDIYEESERKKTWMEMMTKGK